MPCAFELTRPPPHERLLVGCPFEWPESSLVVVERKRWCPFHLPWSYQEKEWNFGKTEWFAKQLFDYLAKVTPSGKVGDFSGVIFPPQISFADLWKGKEFPGSIFPNAHFHGEVSFGGLRFAGPLDMRGAVFHDDATFRKAVFTKTVQIPGAYFHRAARFDEAQFYEDTDFSGAKFAGLASFADTSFDGHANFSDAVFGGNAQFTKCNFKGGLMFVGAAFSQPAFFRNSRFLGGNNFIRCSFKSGVSFGDAVFENDAQFIESLFFQVADFSDTRFGKTAHFDKARFLDQANFGNARFFDAASFGGAAFEGMAMFSKAQFGEWASFAGAGDESKGGTTFQDGVYFVESTFRGSVDFSNRRFLKWSDFERANFLSAPRFHNSSLHQDTNFTGAKFQDFTSEHAARAYRTLKQAMEGVRAWGEMATFFALEQKSLRYRADTLWSVKVVSYLYDLTSHYGRSLIRPVAWLALANGIFFVIYSATISFMAGQSVSQLGIMSIVRFALLQVVRPFHALSAKTVGADWIPPFDVSLVLGLIAAIHSLVSLTLLALFLLALRWRFRRA